MTKDFLANPKEEQTLTIKRIFTTEYGKANNKVSIPILVSFNF